VKAGKLAYLRLGGNVIRIPALALEEFSVGQSLHFMGAERDAK
jgi:hypothetical protein